MHLKLLIFRFSGLVTPRSVEVLEVGFYNGASGRIPEMLIGREVAMPSDDDYIDAVPAQR